MQNEDTTRALITGASQGLGRALALTLAERGAQLILVARRAEPLAGVADEVRALGGTAHAIAADVASPDPSALAARATELLGGVDLLIHNASTLGPVPMPHLSELDDDALRRVFEVNVLGPQRLTRALVGPMRRRRRGAVVTISSDAAAEAYPGWGAYGASKAALDHLSRVLAAELEGSGVRVLAVDPGEMDTEMHAQALPDADPATLARPDDVAKRIVALLDAPPADVRVAL